MAEHAYKFPPASSFSSMGSVTRRVPEPVIATQTNKQRFRAAVNAYKTASGSTSPEVAEMIGMDPKAFNHAMSSDPQRPVSLSQVQAAEALAQSVRAAVSDAEIVRVVREYATASARKEWLFEQLREGVA